MVKDIFYDNFLENENCVVSSGDSTTLHLDLELVTFEEFILSLK